MWDKLATKSSEITPFPPKKGNILKGESKSVSVEAQALQNTPKATTAATTRRHTNSIQTLTIYLTISIISGLHLGSVHIYQNY